MPDVARFQKLFRGRETQYGKYRILPEGAKDAKTVSRSVPAKMWDQHLTGGDVFGLGIVPITQDNLCYFGALDLDDNAVDHAALARKVEKLDLPFIVCRSKSGGAHLYVFTREAVPAALMVERLKQWAAMLGLANPDARALEVFPKQTRLAKGHKGSWINLPYFGGDETDRYAVTSDGAHLRLDQFLAIAERLSLTLAELQEWEATTAVGEEALPGAPPCLQTLHAQGGYADGTRNQGMYNVAIYFKLAYPDDWRVRCRHYNQEMMHPPIEPAELEATLESVSDRDYVYKGNELPLSPVCCMGSRPDLKRSCAARKFGCSAHRRAAIAAHMPELSNLRKLLTDPPRWLLDVAGVEVELTTSDLMGQQAFRRAVVERTNVIVPQLKVYEWDDVLRDLMADLEEIEAPEDAGTIGLFKAHLREFLEFRRQSQRRDDMLLGRPYAEQGWVYFRATDLAHHLDQRRFKHYNQAEVYSALRALGAKGAQFKVAGACVRCWAIPEPQDDQSEEFDLPGSDTPEF